MAVVVVMVFRVEVLRVSLVRTEVRCGEDGTTPHGARGTGQAARKWAEFEEPIPACSLIWDRGGKRTRLVLAVTVMMAAVIALAVVTKGRGY